MHRGRLLVDMATKTMCHHQETENDELGLNSPVSTKNESATQREDSEVLKEQPTISILSPSTINQVLQEIDVKSMATNVNPITVCNQRKYYISPMH